MAQIPATATAFPETEVSVLDAYLRGLPSRGTRQVYRRAIRAFDAFLGDRDLLAASRRDLEAFRAHLDNLGRAPATIARMMSAIAGLFDFALDEELVDRNPAARARRPKVPTTSPRRGLLPTEVGALLRVPDQTIAIGQRDKALLLVLIVQGWRVSEALSLRVEDLDDEGGHRVATILGKGSTVFRVPLAAPVWEAINTWLSVSEIAEGPIFVPVGKEGAVKKGRAMSRQSAWKRVRLIAQQAGLTRAVYPHLFRHTCASEALAAGLPLHQVQDHLRHADPRTTRRYDSHRQSLNNPTPHVLASRLMRELIS